MQTLIDHLVIGAASLRQGVDYVKDCLGVDMPFGGVHEKMGTHNHLMQLGDDIFLEIIAVHPEIEAPDRPRWFGLDDPLIQRHIEMQPALLTWVVRTENLRELKQRAAFSVGEIEEVTRGNLSWYFGLPGDGRLLAGGMLPYIIQWRTDVHPCANMANLDCRFESLEIYHPCSAWLQNAIASIGAANLVSVKGVPRNETACLKAYISTPNGMMELSSGHRR